MTAWATIPQAAQIDALIGRAGRLTLVECDRLVAIGAAAREAAREAARGAARDAARFGAGVAAWDAAQVAVWFAARVAAGALVVRDLIDEATPWNQAAYDLLTGPWRTVIGPIHPDDADLRVQT